MPGVTNVIFSCIRGLARESSAPNREPKPSPMRSKITDIRGGQGEWRVPPSDCEYPCPSEARVVNRRGGFQRTELMESAKAGCVEKVVMCLEFGADIKLADEFGKSALHLAAENGHQSAVDLLLKHDAEVNARDAQGETALHLAARSGRFEVIESLAANGADLNACNKRNQTPLMVATEKGWMRAMECLRRAAGDAMFDPASLSDF